MLAQRAASRRGRPTPLNYSALCASPLRGRRGKTPAFNSAAELVGAKRLTSAWASET
jgi:hypothetical protein